jgi:hypothetical protein
LTRKAEKNAKQYVKEATTFIEQDSNRRHPPTHSVATPSMMINQRIKDNDYCVIAVVSAIIAF